MSLRLDIHAGTATLVLDRAEPAECVGFRYVGGHP